MTQQDQLIALENYLGITNIEAAVVLGVSYSTYMKWRTDTRKIPAIGWQCIKYVRQLARLGVDFTYE